MRVFNPNISLLLKPLVILSVTIVLLSYSIKTGYTKVFAQINEYKKAQQSQNDLNEKIKTLKEVKQGVLGQGDKTILALPEKNPTIWLLSQLKTNAQEVGVDFGSVDLLGASEEDGVKKVNIEVTVLGSDFHSLLTFLSNIAKFAPITTISSATFAKASVKDNISLKIDLFTYWASLPKVLPPISEPIAGLTDKEKETLSRIADLRNPTFTILEPLAPTERTEPFN